MQIEKSRLESAALKAGINKSQIEELWNELQSDPDPVVSKFSLSHVLYYFGAMIVIVALGWFLGIVWERFGSGGILALVLAYMVAFVIAGNALWKKEGLKVPGGLLITLAVCLIPLAVYSFEKWTGWWVTEEPGKYKDFISWIRGGWFIMEAATIIGGCLALKFYRFPFLTMPIFFALWYMSMDITPLLFQNAENSWNNSLWVSLWFGLGMLIISYWIDLKAKGDFAFWGYLFGVATFWGGLSLLDTNSELNRFFYCLINIGLILLSVFLQRTVFLIFGAIGVLIYVTSIFYRYFSDSAWFPIALSLVGLFVIYIGLMYHKNREKIDAVILNLIPSSLRDWIPSKRK